jgi:hypothetical protein
VKPRLADQENQAEQAQKAFETTKKDITYGNPEWIGVQNMLSHWTEVQSDMNNITKEYDDAYQRTQTWVQAAIEGLQAKLSAIEEYKGRKVKNFEKLDKPQESVLSIFSS